MAPPSRRGEVRLHHWEELNPDRLQEKAVEPLRGPWAGPGELDRPGLPVKGA